MPVGNFLTISSIYQSWYFGIFKLLFFPLAASHDICITMHVPDVSIQHRGFPSVNCASHPRAVCAGDLSALGDWSRRGVESLAVLAMGKALPVKALPFMFSFTR